MSEGFIEMLSSLISLIFVSECNSPYSFWLIFISKKNSIKLLISLADVKVSEPSYRSGFRICSRHHESKDSHKEVISSSKFLSVTIPVNSLLSLFQIIEKTAFYSPTMASMHCAKVSSWLRTISLAFSGNDSTTLWSLRNCLTISCMESSWN